MVFEKAQVVKQIFEWIGRDRLSIGEVCRRRQGQGGPSPTGKPRWSRTTVWGMLKNPAYKGSAAYGKTRVGERRSRLRPGRNRPDPPRRTYSVYVTPPEERVPIEVPALVGEELYQAIAEQLAENRQRNREGGRGARYLLQGLLECGCCGYAYEGKRTGGASAKGKIPHIYYRCVGTDAGRFGGQRICWNKQVRMQELDEVVWNDICRFLRDPAAVRREYERRLNEDCSTDDFDGAQLSKRIHGVKRGISRLIDAYESGLIEKGEFEPRIRNAKEKRERLEAELEHAARRQGRDQELRLAICRLEEFAARVGEGLDGAD